MPVPEVHNLLKKQQNNWTGLIICNNFAEINFS